MSDHEDFDDLDLFNSVSDDDDLDDGGAGDPENPEAPWEAPAAGKQLNPAAVVPPGELDELKGSIKQLFFSVCVLFEAIARREESLAGPVVEPAGEDGPAIEAGVRAVETGTPWWVWANLGMSGLVVFLLLVSLAF